MCVKRTEIVTDYSLIYVVHICQVSFRLIKGSHLSRRNKKKCLEECCANTTKTVMHPIGGLLKTPDYLIQPMEYDTYDYEGQS